MVIGFSDNDYTSVLLPHTNALVVMLTMENPNVHHTLVGKGSSTYILYWLVNIISGVGHPRCNTMIKITFVFFNNFSFIKIG
jgi:hypothetical protein